MPKNPTVEICQLIRERQITTASTLVCLPKQCLCFQSFCQGFFLLKKKFMMKLKRLDNWIKPDYWVSWVIYFQQPIVEMKWNSSDHSSYYSVQDVPFYDWNHRGYFLSSQKISGLFLFYEKSQFPIDQPNWVAPSAPKKVVNDQY